ncbi:MAG TPA: electron transfer flavoprotein subunit beta/FixA family protein [Actinomycetota bacterium]|nr:electron transfer flavoprotein subunit beta/FixA family protein [Actinomycetota bacterium]
MNIVVCVKRVPDTAADKKLDPNDFTLDRESVEAVMNPVDEYGVEEALKLRDAQGGEVTVLTMGPEPADKEAVRKALALGADKGVLVTDDRLHGSDALATAYVLALALAQVEFDLVLLGSESTDARTSLVPQALGQFMGMTALTDVKKLEVADGKVTVQREEEGGYSVIEAELPAIVSVVKGINEPRYATLKGIMGAKQKPVETMSGDDLGIDDELVGLTGSKTEVIEATPRPPKEQGEMVKDDGDGHMQLAEFLQKNKFI